jgi:hypothetical protein
MSTSEHSADRTADQAAHSRQSPRDSLFLLATCHLPQRHEEQRIKVRNLSATGLMAEGPVQAVVGEPVSIDLRNVGRVDGIVAWVQATRFGVAFADAIDPVLVRQPASFTPAPEADPRNYYQRGPVSVITRQDETRTERLRPI